MKNYAIKSTPWLIFALLIILYCLFSLDIIAMTKFFSYTAYTIIIVCLIINIFDTYYKPKIQFGTLIVTVLIVVFALILHVILCFRPFTLKYVETPNGIKITGYHRNIDNDYGNFKLVLPDEIGGKKVVTIGSNAFYKSECFDVLVIPKYVKKIEEYAFQSSNVNEIQLNEGLEIIGKCAFESLNNINNINCLDYLIIPTSVNTIEDRALDSIFNVIIFQNNKFKDDYETILNTSTKAYFNVDDYKMHEGVLYVLLTDNVSVAAVDSTYKEINILESIVFDDVLFKVKSIGENSFNRASVEKVNIPTTITKIGDYAFAGCLKLDYILIAKNVIEMGNKVFNCTKLTILLEDKEMLNKWNDNWHCNNEIVFV